MTIAVRETKRRKAANRSGDARRYEKVAFRVAALIDAGTLRVGDRIPSVREMSKQLGVAIGTVLHAYRLLEVRGRIEARPQSGYYVRPALPPLPEPRVSSPSTQAIRPTIGKMVVRMSMLSTDPGMVPLGGAIPSPESLPTRQLNRLGAAAARR
ncbi:MAG TPA: GntR family transcriptional regulator, partial [Tepidisphaeraceae bacterium]